MDIPNKMIKKMQ